MLVAPPASGTLDFASDGSFAYAPSGPSFVGTVSFTYLATDGTPPSLPATVTIEVINSAPSAVNVAFDTHQGTPLALDKSELALSGSDADADELTVSFLSGPIHGMLSDNGDGTVTYIPGLNYAGLDSFTYRVNDGAANSNTATVTINVADIAPSAQPQTVSGSRGEVLSGNVLTDASDADGDALTAELVLQAVHGSVQLEADGTFRYTPEADFAGTDSFTFQVKDGAKTSPVVRVTLGVSNAAPEAAGVIESVHQGSSIIRQLDAWDVDGDPLAYTVSQAGHGTISVNNSGEFTYTPHAGYVGDDTFTFHVNDGVVDSAEATVTIHVTNTRPQVADAIYTVSPHAAGLSGTLQLLDRAWDNDNDRLTLTTDSVRTVALGHGTLTVAADGHWSYAPSGHSAGIDTFTYKVSDGAEESDPATVTIEVPNEAPQVHEREFQFAAGRGAISGNNRVYSFNLLNSAYVIDTDQDATTVELVSGAGQVSLTPQGQATLTVDKSFLGTITFAYRAWDGIAYSAPATVTVEVNNALPQAADDLFSIRAGGSVTFKAEDLLKNDIDADGDALAITSLSAPAGGTLTQDPVTGEYTYTPGNFVGTATLSYQLSDDVQTSAPATVSIEVVNTAPWVVGGSYQVRVGEDLSVPALSQRGAVWDSETAAYTASLVGTNNAIPSLSVDGSFVYHATTPGTYTITYKVNDGHLDSETATVTIEVQSYGQVAVSENPAKYGSFVFDEKPAYAYSPDYSYTPPASVAATDTPPAAADDGYFVALHGTTVQVSGATVLANDYDPDGSLQVLGIAIQASHGTVTWQNGTFTYVPTKAVGAPDYVGDDSFTYWVTDGVHSPVSAAVKLRFTNHAPRALGGEYTFVKGTTTHGPFKLDGSDLDSNDQDTLQYTIVSVSPGSLTQYPYYTGNYLFNAPSPDWTGTATIAYTVTDGAGATATGVATVEIVTQMPPEEPSITAVDDEDFCWGPTHGSNVFLNDKYTHGATLRTTATTIVGAYGTFTLDIYGSFTYTVTPGQEAAFVNAGGEPFDYTATATLGEQSASGTAKIYIRPKVIRAGDSTVSSGDITVSNSGGPLYVCMTGANVYLKPEKGVSFDVGVTSNSSATANVTWAGDASYLGLSVAGTIVSPISITGHANLSATGNIPDVTAQTIRASAGGNLGNLHANDRLFSANAGGYGVASGGNIASTYSGSQTYRVWASHDVGAVQSGGDVGSVIVGNDVASVGAAGSVGKVHAGHNISGNVTATGGDIGFFHLGGDGFSSFYQGRESSYIYPAIGGVFASNEIVGNVSAAAGNIAVVHAEQDVKGSVTAGQTIYYVRSQNGSIANTITAGRHIGLVEAKLDVGQSAGGQNVTATSGYIGKVFAHRDVLATIHAGKGVGGVLAGKQVRSGIRADDGSILVVSAGAEAQSDGKYYGKIDTSSPILAGQNIGRITSLASAGCGGEILASAITATNGYIGDVTAHAALQAQITAKLSIGVVQSGVTNEGGIVGPIESNSSSIEKITANKGSVSGNVTAKTDVGSVWARDSITGTISAERYVENVTAQTGSVAAVAGQKGIGDVTAGLDINGAIQSVLGGIGSILAGAFQPGDILGNVQALKNIRSVEAKGKVVAPSQWIDPVVLQTLMAQLTQWVNDPNADPGSIPRPPAFQKPSLNKGNIAGSVQAQGNIGRVAADGHIEQTVHADGTLPSVSAQGNILGAVSCGLSSMTVLASGDILGSLTAAFGLSATALGAIKGSLTAQTGPAYVAAGADLSGAVRGEQGAQASSYGDITSPTIDGGSGAVSVMGRNVQSQVSSSKTIGLGALNEFKGSATSQDGSVVVGALGGIDADIKGKAEGALRSLSKIAGSINLRSVELQTADYIDATIDVDKTVMALARYRLTGSITSKEGSIVVQAGRIDSPKISAPAGSVGLLSFGDCIAPVDAKKTIAIRASGEVKGPLTTGGSIFVVADGDVRGGAHAKDPGGDVVIVAWGNLSGGGGGGATNPAAKPEADVSSAEGTVNVFVHGPITASISAGADAIVSTWDKVDAAVTAKGSANVTARKDVAKEVTAKKNAKVIAGGDILGPVTAGDGTMDKTATAAAVAHGKIETDVTSSGSATADAMGNVKGNVTAWGGKVLVSAFDGYQGVVAAATEAKILSGKDVTGAAGAKTALHVSAHGTIQNFTGKSDGNATILADASIGQGTKITAKGTANLSSLGDISSAEVKADGDVRVFAGTSADVTAESVAGKLDVVALGSASGKATAAKDVFVAAYGKLTKIEVVSKTGSASVFARNSMTGAKVSAATQLIASGLADIRESSFNSSGSVDVFAATLFDSPVTGETKVKVGAGYGISGKITSKHGDITAISAGYVSATIEAQLNALVGALGGVVAGSVTTTSGSATVAASDDITASINAGKDAQVRSLSSITGAKVEAKKNADVTAYKSVQAPVTAKAGSARVVAGEQITAAVLGHVSATARTMTGAITAAVTAEVASAGAVAGGPITGAVTGQVDALSASLDRVSGNVKATTGYAAAIAQGGDVSANVTAGRGAAAIARGNVAGPVSAGIDALAGALGSVVGAVSAGRDALVIAGNGVGGRVSAQRNAAVVSYGAVTGGVSAAVGDAVVITWGAVSGGVEGGDSAYVWAGSGVEGGVSGTNDVGIVAFGSSSPFVFAGRDAYLWTAGTSDGAVSAGRDALLVALDSSATLIHAGRDVVVLAFGDYQSDVFAGRDAFVASQSGAKANITAGGDAAVYAAEFALGSIDAEGYAGLVCWGSAVGPYGVDGKAGAFAFVYQNFIGAVASAEGSGVLTVFDTAVGSVSAGEDALAAVVGLFIGSVSAGDSAGAVALGGFRGTVTAGLDGFVLSEGDAVATLTAGRDAFVWTVGDALGVYRAGRDLAAVSYGDLGAKLVAGRDVGFLWTRGDLEGTVSAGRDVGRFAGNYYADPYDYDVLSYGAIRAVIEAGSPTGRIGRVGAWRDVAGRLHAGESIGEVHAGDLVLATRVAPQQGAVVEHDAAFRAAHPYPATPESIKDALLAEAGAVYDDVLDQRAQTALSIVEVLLDCAARRKESFAKRDALIAEVAAANAKNKTSAADTLARDLATAQQEAARLKAQADKAVQAAQAAAGAIQKAIADELAIVIGARNASYQAAKALKDAETADLKAADADMAEAKNGWQKASEKARQEWQKGFDEQVAKIKRDLNNIFLADLREFFRWTALVSAFVPKFGWYVSGLSAAASFGISVYLGDKWGIFWDGLGVLPFAGSGWRFFRNLTKMATAEGRMAQAAAQQARLFDPVSNMLGRGRRYGEIVGAEQLAALKNELAEKGVWLSVGEVNAAGRQLCRFRPYPNGRAQMWLPSNATRYEVLHEMRHAAHWMEMGKSYSAWRALSQYAREKEVFIPRVDGNETFPSREDFGRIVP